MHTSNEVKAQYALGTLTGSKVLAVLNDPSTPGEVIREINTLPLPRIGAPWWDWDTIKRTIASHRNTPPDVLDDLAKVVSHVGMGQTWAPVWSEIYTVRLKVANNPNTSIDTLKRLIQYEVVNVVKIVAKKNLDNK